MLGVMFQLQEVTVGIFHVIHHGFKGYPIVEVPKWLTSRSDIKRANYPFRNNCAKLCTYMDNNSC